MHLHISLLALSLALLLPRASGHGFPSHPRNRGALRTIRNVNPQVIDPEAPIDFCSYCQNAGGRRAVRNTGGPYRPYLPMEGNTRGGFGICGDPHLGYDHMKIGKYKNPDSTPFVADYTPGGVANFEFDITTNHGGWIEYYICDGK